MSNEFKLKDILAAIDLDGKEVWDELTDEQMSNVEAAQRTADEVKLREDAPATSEE